MVSENSPSLLRASLTFFLASLMLGSAAMYIQFGIVCVLAVWVLRWSGLKQVAPILLAEGKLIGCMLFAFGGIFVGTLIVNDAASIAEASELKWMLFLIAFVLAIRAVPMNGKFTKLEKFAFTFLIVVAFYSMIDAIHQAATGKNLARHVLFGVPEISGRRGAGLLKSPIPFSHVVGSLFFIMVVGATISFRLNNKRFASVLSGLGLILFISILSSLSRGAWFGLAIASAFSVFVVPKRFCKIHFAGLGSALLLGIVFLIFNQALFQRLVSAFDLNDVSNSTRIQLWQANWSILKENPMGIGFNVNDAMLPSKLVELGYSTDVAKVHPHNEFLDYTVASGWTGGLLYLGITIWFIAYTVKVLRRFSLDANNGELFLLTSSALVQVFLNVCALTDQFTTPGRFLICLAWMVPLALSAKRKAEKDIGNAQ